jgi:nucleotide-binding universal stress UspA family protein
MITRIVLAFEAGRDGFWLARWLRARSIEAFVIHSTSVAAKAEGCDLLVKGAFTRNRLRQMIFGGATSHIMQHADLPLLMAH